MTGIVKRINREKSFGFIQGEDRKEYFFHKSALMNIEFHALEEKQKVTFEDSEGAKGLRAEGIYV